MFQTVGLRLGAAQIISIQKTAGQVKEMKIIQPDFSGKYLGDMGDYASSNPPRRQAWAASISQLVPLPVITIARVFAIYSISP